MSEEVDIFDDLVEKNDDVVDVTEVKDLPQEDLPENYISIEKWEAMGRDPKDWQSPKEFKATTEIISLKKALRQKNEEVDSRLANMSLLHQAQLSRQRQELISQRDDAIDIADRKKVNDLDRQIAAIDNETSLAKPNEAPINIPKAVVEWNQENSWLTPDHPLRQKANKVYEDAIADGETIRGALKIVDTELAKLNAPKIANKVPPKSMVDSPKQGIVHKNDAPIAWSSLSSQEQAIWDEGFFPDTKEGKSRFLQACADDRRSRK